MYVPPSLTTLVAYRLSVSMHTNANVMSVEIRAGRNLAIKKIR